MKIIELMLCLLSGHNKILKRDMENGYFVYYDLCSQCNKKWLNKELTENQKFQYDQFVKMKGHGQSVTIKKISKINSSKKTRINIYAI